MHLRFVVRIFNNRYPVDNKRQAKWFRFLQQCDPGIDSGDGQSLDICKENELGPVHTLSGFHNCSVASQEQPIRQGRQLFPSHHMRP